jgi:hypothetical protein
MKFKGFEDYIEIFKGGLQTDSTGNTHDGNELIDKALASFNTEEHEPPAVVGHPKDNAPAFAWVEDLKEEIMGGTKILLAKFKQVVPEFEEMVKQGLFKKRSASFYPDGRLRHVGFLGAAPPAVKGLAEIGFKENEQLTFEFEESWKIKSIGQLLSNIREFIIEKFGIDDANKVLSQWELEDIKTTTNASVEEFSSDVNKQGDKDMEFSQEELDKKIEQAKKDEREKVEGEHAKKAREKQFSNDLAGVQEFCDSMVKEGKIAPSWLDSGLKQFLESLAGSEAIEFSEDKKQTPLEWVKDFFENQMPKLIEFDEVATRDKDLPEIESEFAECEDEGRLELHRKIKALAAKENISYAEAADRVAE